MLRSLLAGGAIAFLSGTAFAQTAGTYFAPDGGTIRPSSLNVSSSSTIAKTELLTTGSAVGVSYGYDLGNGFKAGIEGVTPRESAGRFGELPASGSLTAGSVMLQGLYEFRDGAWHTKPYAGAGFGAIDVSQRFLGVRGNDWVPAYQLRGGVSLGFTQKLLGSLEYRWTKGSKPNFSLGGIPTKVEIDRHGVVVGVNYKY